ncbi:hypothetical protein OAB94_02125 [Flavobacteriaceae bacterium]|nr:hypothetical protein [Flavobacteriaceae bacterium]
MHKNICGSVKRDRQGDDDNDAKRKEVYKAVKKSMKGTEYEHKQMMHAIAKQYQGEKEAVFSLLSIPRSKWPYFMEDKLFLEDIASYMFEKEIDKYEYKHWMGEMIRVNDDDSVLYYPNKTVDQPLREYLVLNRHLLNPQEDGGPTMDEIMAARKKRKNKK